ncbi:MAG: cyanophycin synthetase [Lentisphaeria bacterium]
MRDWDPQRETAFFDLFADCRDLERETLRRAGQGVFTLDRMPLLAALAGHPEQRLKLVHVAGTKGKGSTSFFLGALLEAAGESAAVYTSPHLASVRERFWRRDAPVGYDALESAARELRNAMHAGGLHPTFFEVLTVLGLRLAADAGCRWCVLEAGIGGRLDATNFIPPPAACVITPVSLDHMPLLGTTAAEIAAEKAGILKRGVPLVLAPQPFPEAEAVIRAAAAQLHCPVTGAATRPAGDAGRWPEYRHWPAFLQENFRTALATCEVLGIRPDPARFRRPRLRGRFELLRQEPPVLLDAAHNADSARRLAEALRAAWPNRPFTVVLGVVQGKDAAGIFRELRPAAAEFILTHPRNADRGSELETLEALAATAGVPYRVIPDLQSAADLPAGRPLVFTGSFFTALIGEELFNPATPGT